MSSASQSDHDRYRRHSREQRRYRGSDHDQQNDREGKPHHRQAREDRDRWRHEDQDYADRIHREEPPIPISLDRYNPDRLYDARQGPGNREPNSSSASHGAGGRSYWRDRSSGRGSDSHRGGPPFIGWQVTQKRTGTATATTGGMGQGRSAEKVKYPRREDRPGGVTWGIRPRSIPLPKRPWTIYGPDGHPSAIEDPKAATKGGGDCLTVMCWNMLAQSLIDFTYMPYCNRTEMDRGTRLTGILEVIKEQQPDLLCMQEDDMHEELSTELAELGYSATHKKRTSPDKKDGCSIFWRTAAGLEMIEVVEVEYQRQVPHMDRDNVAVIAVLEDREGRRLLCANTHLLYNPKRGDVKLAQARCIVSTLEELAKRQPASATVGVVLCGDFNSTPMSAVYQFLSTGALDVSGLNRTSLSGQTLIDSRDRMAAYSDAWTYRPGNVTQARHQGSGTSRGRYCAPPQPSTPLSTPAEPQRQKKGKARKGKEVKADEGALIAVTQTTEQDMMVVTGPHSVGTVQGVSEVRDTILVMATVDSDSGTQQFEDMKVTGDSPSQREDVVPALRPEGHTSHPPHTPSSPWPSISLHVSPYGQPPITHNLRLASAYAQRPDANTSGEPAFTSFHKSFKGCVDFLWYDTSGGLRCLGVLEMPLLNQLVERLGLPCLGNPSDHLPLVARFRFEDNKPR